MICLVKILQNKGFLQWPDFLTSLTLSGKPLTGWKCGKKQRKTSLAFQRPLQGPLISKAHIIPLVGPCFLQMGTYAHSECIPSVPGWSWVKLKEQDFLCVCVPLGDWEGGWKWGGRNMKRNPLYLPPHSKQGDKNLVLIYFYYENYPP